MPTGTQYDRPDVRRLRGAVVAAWASMGVVALGAAELALRSGGRRHLAEWFAWAVAAAVVVVAVQADRVHHRRRGRRLTLGVALADGLLAVTASAAVLLVTFGVWLALIGVVLCGVVLLEWVARHRALRGHRDGPALLAGISAVLTYCSLQRPWTPSSGQWPLVTAAACLATGLALVSFVSARNIDE